MDDRSFAVTITDQGKRVTARFIIDESGRLINFVTQRYREHKGKDTLDTWTTPMTGRGMLAGLNLPLHGQAVWKLATGDLPYGDLKLTEIEYNGKTEEF